MGLYAMTGGATGIGAALRGLLQDRGDEVIVVDIQDGDIIADLSTAAGREAAVAGIRERAPDGLDGLIPCAGVPPVAQPITLLPQVNYFGTTVVVNGLLDVVAKRQGVVLLVSSNSAPMVPVTHPYVEALLAADEAQACELIAAADGHTGYAGSKCALTVWMRRHTTEFAKRGVRINAVAPGITDTPLSRKVMDDAELGQIMRDFGDSVPLGATAQPEQIAAVMAFMLSPGADFMTGSFVVVDGGSDAMLRPDQF